MTVITGQEYRVLAMLAEGCTQEAIARQLKISARTVRRRVVSLRAKLDAVNDAHAISVAYQHRWLTP